jgi:hypothetical protein
MNELLNGLVIGVVIGACMLLIRLVDFMLDKYGRRGNGGSGFDANSRVLLIEAARKIQAIDFQALSTQTSTMFVQHAKTDEDGVPVWYVRRSLESAIHKLSENVNSNTQFLRDQTVSINRQTEMIGRLVEEIRQQSNNG